MLPKFQLGLVILATLLVIASGYLFYRILVAEVGAGGDDGYLSNRVFAIEEDLIEVQRALSILVTPSSSENPEPTLVQDEALIKLGDRVTAVEDTLRISPEDAILVPMLKRDVDELRTALSDTKDDFSTWHSTTQNLVVLLYGVIISLALIAIGPRLGRLLRWLIGGRP